MLLHRQSAASRQSCRRPARAPLRVVAFRDVKHSEKLTTIGQKYVSAWVKGVHHGPKAVEEELAKLVDADVRLASSHSPYEHLESVGVGALLDKVGRDHARGMYPARIVFTAANETTDTVFFLVENRPRRAGNCPAEQDVKDAAAIPTWTTDVNDEWSSASPSCPTYSHSILKLRITPDGAVASVRECCQPAIDTGAAFPMTRAMENEQAEDSDRAAQLNARWVWAMSSGGDLAALDRLTQPSFRFFDAYGHVDKYARNTVSDEGHDLAFLKDRNTKIKSQYSISAQVVDCAASSQHTVGFLHWRLEFSPLPQAKAAGKEPFIVNCMQAETYQTLGKDTRLTSVWAFRDLMRPEMRMEPNPNPSAAWPERGAEESD